MAEADPTGRDPHAPGSKLDAGKSPVLRGVFEYFPRALLAVADVSAAGAAKYTWRGWEGVPDGIARYGDALARHILKERIEGDNDVDTGLLHAAHAAWNALARLEMVLREQSAETDATRTADATMAELAPVVGWRRLERGFAFTKGKVYAVSKNGYIVDDDGDTRPLLNSGVSPEEFFIRPNWEKVNG